MEQIHRKAIQSNFTSLVERTDLDSVVTALYEKGVFSERMIEPYKDSNDSVRERKRKLYLDIMRRGPNAFSHLIEALSELGYWDIVRDLDPSNMLRLPDPNFNLPKLNPPLRDVNNAEFVSISTEKYRQTKDISKSTPAPASLPPYDNVAPDPDEMPHFHVIKSTKFMEDHNSKDLKLYRTRGRMRGVLLVFSYISFKDDIEDYRNGVDIDCNKLKYLFAEIGFKVFSYPNLSLEQTTNTLKELKDVLVDTESVFIVVSSHGYQKVGTWDTDVRCSDGQLISLYEIMEYFNNRNLPGLIGIPKVFIFQSCRGSNKDYTWKDELAPPQLSMPSDVQTDGTPAPPAAAPLRGQAPLAMTPLYSDILIAHSTLPGFVSHRDVKDGSWYIQVLCEVFAARAHDCHVDKLFTLVDQCLQDKFKVQTSSVDRWGFNKRLYLHPGLHE